MPYQVRKNDDDSFRVENTDTGEVHSKHTTKEKAEAQVRLLHGVEHGMKPRRRVVGGS